MKNKVINTLFRDKGVFTLAGRNNLILSSPSPQKGRGSNGKTDYFSQGGYYG
jgi:hypothetical protein